MAGRGAEGVPFSGEAEGAEEGEEQGVGLPGKATANGSARSDERDVGRSIGSLGRTCYLRQCTNIEAHDHGQSRIQALEKRRMHEMNKVTLTISLSCRCRTMITHIHVID